MRRIFVEQMEKCGYTILVESNEEEVDIVADLVCEKFPNTEVCCLKDVCVMYRTEEGKQACKMFLEERAKRMKELLQRYDVAISHMEN